MNLAARRAGAAVAVLAAAIAAPACASRGARPPTLAEAYDKPAPIEQLRRDLRVLFTHASVNHASWAVDVQSLRHGDTLYSLDRFKLHVPASNQKLVTSAVAAERLGWDFRFTTRIFATGPIGADGTLDGHLVVSSDGDPTINPRHPDRWAAFDRWAAALAARGLRLVAGELVGDDSAFAGPGWGTGWAWDDLALGYGAPIGALQYHENQVEVMVGPGQEAGARAIVSLSPLASGLTVDHDVVTAPPGGETRVVVERIPGSTLLRVRGRVAVDAKPVIQLAAVANPTQMYLNALREALARHGIFVGGAAVDIDDLRVKPDLGAATLLVEDRSPPLSEVIDVTLRWSRNGYAETLLRALALTDPPATEEAALRALGETMRTWGVPDERYVARDGSGLSRYDYITADALTWLLTYLWLDPVHHDRFRATLPVAGVSGSLADRMKGTTAEGRVWAKTGSMSQVRALSGYLLTAEDEPLVFSIVVNGFRLPTRDIDAVVDRALVRLAGFRRIPARR